MRAAATVIPACALLATASCTTVSVSNVELNPEAAGIRYSLPKPVIQAVPKSDGSMEVSVLLIPDAQHEYALDARSYMASHQLTSVVEGGLLTKLSWNPDSTKVAADLIKATGEIAQSVLEQEAAIEDARVTAINTQKATLATAEKDLAIAEAKLSALESTGSATPTELNAARSEVAQKRAARDAQLNTLAEVSAADYTHSKGTEINFSGVSGTITVNRPADPQGSRIASKSEPATVSGGSFAKRVYGGVLFAVDEVGQGEDATVTLRPITRGGEYQSEYQTGTTREPPIPRIKQSGVLAPTKKDGVATVSYTTTEKILRIVTERATGSKLGSGRVNPPPISYDGDTTITVSVDGLDPGSYEFAIPFEYRSLGQACRDALLVRRDSMAFASQVSSAIDSQVDHRADRTLLTTNRDILDIGETSLLFASNPDAKPSVSITGPRSIEILIDDAGQYAMSVPFSYAPPCEGKFNLRFSTGNSPHPRLFPEGFVGVVPDANGSRRTEFTVTPSVRSIDYSAIVCTKDGVTCQDPVPVSLTNENKLIVHFQQTGVYDLTIPYRFDSPPRDDSWQVRIHVQK